MSRIRRFAPHVKVRHTNYFRLIAEESGVTFTMTIGANVPTTSLAWIEYSVDEGKNWNRTYNVNNSKITITMPKINTKKITQVIQTKAKLKKTRKFQTPK